MPILAMVGILFLAVLFRLVGIADEPIWLDEAISATRSDGSLAKVVEKSARDSHPPLYFSGLSLWKRIAGRSPTALRSFSVVTSLAGIALVTIGVFQWKGRYPALLAGLVLAVHPLDVYYAQEARMYALVSALSALSYLLLWHWARARVRGRDGWFLLAGYTTTASAIILTHYLGIVILLTQGLIVAVAMAFVVNGHRLIAFAAAPIGVSVLFAPWIMYLHSLDLRIHKAYLLDWMHPPTLTDVSSVLFRFLVVGVEHQPPALGTALLAVACLVAGHWLARRVEHRWVIIAAGLIVVPIAIAVASSHAFAPVFYAPRFAMLVLAPVVVGLSVMVTDGTPRQLSIALSVALVIGLGSATVVQARTTSKQGLRDLVPLVSDHAPDALIFDPAMHAITASYEFGRRIRNPQPAVVEATLSRGSSSTVWLCRDRRTTDSDRLPVSAWLDEQSAPVRIGRIGAFDVLEYRIGRDPTDYPPLRPSDVIDAGDDRWDGIFGAGWHREQAGSRWSSGHRSELLFAIPEGGTTGPAGLVLTLRCSGRQMIRARLGDQVVHTSLCTRIGFHALTIDLGPDLRSGPQVLSFEFPDAASPASRLPENSDRRVLAIGLKSIELQAGAAPPAGPS
jgi:hypothetical protein